MIHDATSGHHFKDQDAVSEFDISRLKEIPDMPVIELLANDTASSQLIVQVYEVCAIVQHLRLKPSVVKISKSIPSFLGVCHTRATVITTGLDCMYV